MISCQKMTDDQILKADVKIRVDSVTDGNTQISAEFDMCIVRNQT